MGIEFLNIWVYESGCGILSIYIFVCIVFVLEIDFGEFFDGILFELFLEKLGDKW